MRRAPRPAILPPMSSPHLVPLAVALDLIHSAVAVQVDDSYVTYPAYPDDDEEGICLICAASPDMDSEDMDRFRAADNAMVEVTEDGFILKDARGSYVTIMPLMAAPYKAAPEPVHATD